MLHALILACVLWMGVAANLEGPGIVSRRSGVPKGNDFLVFYVSGTLARDGHWDTLVDDDSFRNAQEPWLGTRSSIYYPAVYPPQVGAFFAPLSRLPYVSAYLLWASVTIALVLFCAGVLLSSSAVDRGDWPAALVALLAFAPFPYLVLAGQASALALCALTLAAVLLRRGSRIGAGMALGLLGYKVSLLAPALGVCFLAGEWLLIAGAVAM